MDLSTREKELILEELNAYIEDVHFYRDCDNDEALFHNMGRVEGAMSIIRILGFVLDADKDEEGRVQAFSGIRRKI